MSKTDYEKYELDAPSIEKQEKMKEQPPHPPREEREPPEDDFDRMEIAAEKKDYYECECDSKYPCTESKSGPCKSETVEIGYLKTGEKVEVRVLDLIKYDWDTRGFKTAEEIVKTIEAAQHGADILADAQEI